MVRSSSISATPDPELLVPMIAEELGVPAGPSLLDSLAAQLRPSRILLVLDNFERLLPPPPQSPIF